MRSATTTPTRVLASVVVVAIATAMVIWVWPEDGSWLQAGLAVLSAIVSVLVLVSLWKK